MVIERVEFLNHVRLQFDSTDPEVIQFNTPFETLDEWCSLVGLGLISMINDKYNLRVRLGELIDVKTVEDLYNIVSQKNV